LRRGAGDRQSRQFRPVCRDRFQRRGEDPRFPQEYSRRDGDGQPAHCRRRLSRALRRHARIELRAARARLRGDRILHPDQDGLHRRLTAMSDGILRPETRSAVYPSLAGRRVIVSGGGSGIGEGIVEAFVRQGAAVAFVDILDGASEALVGRMADADIPPIFVHCDIRDCEDYGAKIEKLIGRLGGCDVLVNNAANDDRHKLEDITPAYWDERMAVNLKHQFFAAKAVIPAMKAAGHGSIVNLGSISWHLGLEDLTIYQTAKAAIEGLTRSLARELGR